jgi:ribonuclease/clavin/mitogillin
VIRPRDVAPGVALFPVRTPTLPPATHTNTFAIGRDELMLVEPATPYEDERAAWLEWARALGGGDRRIVGVLVTHHHVDHASAAAEFARGLDVPLYGHPETFDRLPWVAAARGEVELRPVRDGEPLVAGWFALHTPGHAPGHLCLHDVQGRTLVAGDMVANGSSILIPADDGGDMAAYLAQLRRLDALGVSLVLPAHGEPIDDPHGLFGRYVEHRLMREEKVFGAWVARRRALGREPELHEIVPDAYDDTPTHLWPIARSAAEAHVVKLRREGRI